MKKQSKHPKPKFLIILLIVSVFVSIAAIIYFNYLLISGWFGKEGPANIGSIEVSYIWMATFMRRFGFTSWSPYWYLGFPFHLIYTPLLPVVISVLNSITSTGYWTLYRFWTGISIIIAPIGVFFLGWQLSKRVVGGAISSLFFTLSPTIFYFLFPEVMEDRITTFLDPRRITVLTRWGEGPHSFSLIFMPFLGFFFAKFLHKRRKIWFLLSTLFFGLTAMSNAIGFFASLVLIGVMVFVKFSLAKKDHKLAPIFKALFVGFSTLGIISFWYNISFISSFFGEGGGTISFLVSLFPWGWLFVGFIATVIFFILKRFIKDFGFGTALLYFGVLFFVVYTYYSSAPPDESFRRVEILPQALRYSIEVDMGLSLLIGVVISLLFRLCDRFVGKLSYLIEFMFLVGIIVISGIYATRLSSSYEKITSNFVDLTTTREYAISQWINQNIDPKSGERVFLPGNYGFYHNYFSDVWQARGALFQAATHDWVEHIHYQLVNGEDSELAKAWFAIINAKYAVVTTGLSQELYREVKNTDRFTDLEIVYEDKGDIIYKTKSMFYSPAQSVSKTVLKSLNTPTKADDKKPIMDYYSFIENPENREFRFTMIDNDTYELSGELKNQESILVQMTYDEGFTAAYKNGKGRINVDRDPLGFIVLKPDTQGELTIILKHKSSWKVLLGYVTTILSLVGIILIFVFGISFTKPSKIES